MARSYSVAEVRIGAGPVAGLIPKPVANKIAEQRALYGSKYEDTARIRQGWPSALSRELELRRALAVDPNAKFINEKDDPEFELNETNMIKTIADSPVEIGVLYDKHNRLVSFTKGGKEQVVFEALNSQMEDGHTIHNHPAGGPPSSGDYAAHLYYKWATSKIVSKEGIYIISGKGSVDDSSRSSVDVLRHSLGAIQMHAVQRAQDWAKEVLAKGLSKSKAGTLRASRNADDIRFELGDELATKFNAIIDKMVWEVSKDYLSKSGLKMEFKPSKNFAKTQGFKTHDDVPLPPADWIPNPDYK